MTDPLVRLEQTELMVQPGGQARTKVTVSNPGQIVEGFRLDVLGEPAQWAEITPPEIQVYPQQEASAIVVVSPPAGAAAPSGRFAFAVRARSVVDESRSAVEEGDLEIGAEFGLQSKLTPVTSSGRWSSGHAVELTNWGNATERLRLAVADPDERLAFLVHPHDAEIPVGATVVSSVLVRARRPFLRGAPRRLPFQVVAAPADAGAGPPPPPGTDPRRASLDGAFEQRPLLSLWSVVVAGAAVLLVAALVVWAFNRPRISHDELATTSELAPPTDLTAQPVADNAQALTLAWKNPSRVPEAFTVFAIDPTTSGQRPPRTIDPPEPDDVDGNLEERSVEDLDPGTEYCFQLVARSNEDKSERSEPACATTGTTPTPPPTSTTTSDPTDTSDPPGPTDPPSTPPGPTDPPSSPPGSPPGTSPGGTAPSPGPPDGGEFTPGEWVTVVFVAPEAAGPSSIPQELAADLREQGFDAGMVNSSDFPGFGFQPDFRIVYVRNGLTDEAAAQQFCDDSPDLDEAGNVGCRPAEPGPRAEG